MRAPGVWTLETLFAGRARSLALFHRVREFIESLGPATMAVSKTQVAFKREKNFAWVWLPQTWIKKRRDDGITLAFGLPRRIRHGRIASAVEARPGRWTHHVLIDAEDDFDADVREWIRGAFEFGSRTNSSEAARRRRG